MKILHFGHSSSASLHQPHKYLIMAKLIISEHQHHGYASRTYENVRLADVTMRFAEDFTTFGEKATKNACKLHKKHLIDIPLDRALSFRVDDLSKPMIRLARYADKLSLCINIAGNGIYRLSCEQKQLDNHLTTFLTTLISNFSLLAFPYQDLTFRSGGQSGADEAGIKAALMMGYEAEILAPKGWIFRDKEHHEVHGKDAFCARFEGYGAEVITK